DALERLCPMLPEALPEVPPRRKGRHGRGERLRADAIGRGGQRVWIDGHRGPRPGSLGDAVSRCRTAPPVADWDRLGSVRLGEPLAVAEEALYAGRDGPGDVLLVARRIESLLLLGVGEEAGLHQDGGHLRPEE